MSCPLRLPAALWLGGAIAVAAALAWLNPQAARAEENEAPWMLVSSSEPEVLGPGMVAVEKTLRRDGDRSLFGARKLFLVVFEARHFTFKVIDAGDGETSSYSGIAEALQENFCPAGCNGGFFHPDYRPLGLMIADGDRSNRFETSALLSGVVYADARGLHLKRRAEFEDHAGIMALLQSGPFLVDGGRTVAGLAAEPARRRTFLLWNGEAGDAGHWAIGVSQPLSLADLGNVLATPGVIGEFDVQRALNLDGGSSTGLYFDRGADRDDYLIPPIKRVRNYLGIAPRG